MHFSRQLRNLRRANWPRSTRSATARNRAGRRCVTTPSGFRDAYTKFVEGGWMGLSAPVEWGGQGLPHSLTAAMMEDFNAANLAFALCPMLGLGAIDALDAHGSDELKRDYLPKMISGEWTATMNLTEPQAGSDVGALKSKAMPGTGGDWRVSGNKIFITWGEHDLTDNIVHMVLHGLRERRKELRAFRSSSCRRSYLTEKGTTSSASRLSTSSASMLRRPVSWPTVRVAARRVGSSAPSSVECARCSR